MTRKGGRRGLAGKRTGAADVSPVEGGRTGTRQGQARRTGVVDKDGGGGKRGSVFGRTRKGAADEDGGGGKCGSVFRRTRTGAADEEGHRKIEMKSVKIIFSIIDVVSSLESPLP